MFFRVCFANGAESEVQEILGRESRVLLPESTWTAMTYTIGLEAGRNYVLEVE